MFDKTNSDYVYILDSDNSKAYQVAIILLLLNFNDYLLRWTSIRNWEKFGFTHVIVCRTKTRLLTSLSVVVSIGICLIGLF